MANMYDYHSSNARKLYFDDINAGHNYQRELQTNIKERQAKPIRKAKRGFGGLLGVILTFALAFVVINGYVKINEAKNQITVLQNQYNDIVASNQAIQVKIDKKVDIKELQEVAGERFGMARPERYQMFYVDLGAEDFSENTAQIKKSKTEEKINLAGVPGIISGTLNIFN